jgi:hypothetical protein
MKFLEYYENLSRRIQFINGKPYWTVGNNRAVKAGDLAGRVTEKGHRQIGVRLNGRPKKMISAHRLHYFICYGEIPAEIDHIDRNADNNHIENLRPCTRTQNCYNRSKAKNKTSSYMGVSFEKSIMKYRARITVNGKLKYLGQYTNEIEAAKAYNEAIELYNLQEYANPNIILE